MIRDDGRSAADHLSEGRPRGLVWAYTRAEMVADGVIHAVGVCFALAAGVTLVALAVLRAAPADVAAVSVYAAGMLVMFGASAAYNLWPVSRTKWRLRRLDHAGIFIMIAGTYTPLTLRIADPAASWALLIGVWAVALAGAVLKVALPGRFDRAAIVLYLLLGASGVLAYDAVAASLPPLTFGLVVVGALIYAGGVVFHLWESLRFQNAVWHGFVLAAAGCHYAAILNCVVLAPRA